MNIRVFVVFLVLASSSSWAQPPSEGDAGFALAENAVTGNEGPRRDTWRPVGLMTWQYQLQDDVNTSWDVEMYDIDLFDTPEEAIDILHTKGCVVIASFTAGSLENWRPDAGDYPPALLGEAVGGWPGEYWVDITNLALIQPLMEARLDLAVSKGFDGVEPSQMQNFIFTTGFTITSTDQVVFNEWLAQAAHARGLSVGLKDDADQIADLVDDFDWALVQEIYLFNLVTSVQPFLDAGKAVFGVEYSGDPATICPQSIADGVSVIFKEEELADEPPGGCDLSAVGDPPGPSRVLLHNIPNPFNPRTTIVFDLPEQAMASLHVFDAAGRLIDVLLDQEIATSGRNEVVWRGRDQSGRQLPSGTYFYRLQAGDYVETKRMTLLK